MYCGFRWMGGFGLWGWGGLSMPPWGAPMGMGYPMSGWPTPYPPYGMGQMPGYPTGGQMPFPPGGGFGMSPFGFPMTPEQEIDFLRNQAQMLKQQLDQIDSRIRELERVGR